MYVDSHCHLHLLELGEGDSIESFVKRAKEHKVSHMLCVCTELDEVPTLQKIAEDFEHVDISIGVHPNHQPGQLVELDSIKALCKDSKVVAIGETGLDYFRSTGDLGWQQSRFEAHIELAHEVSKPLIIHTRQAKDDTIDIMRGQNARDVGGVMHCFTEDWAMASKALDLNFYISFSGIVTFKSAQVLQDVAKKVPLDRMLIETDCPYLAPAPHRGKQNEPSYVPLVAEFIANLRQTSVEEIANATRENYFTLFKPL